MADDEDPKPDNVIQFVPSPAQLKPDNCIEADMLLEDCLGEYSEVIIVGIDANDEMVVSGNIADIAQVYDMLATAAQKIAMAHLEMLFHGVEH